ncbi:hypothetical protein [uncultured Methanobrevibacter sp.]|uniref:hypothetical protein n=1 Tax=uncultured Methanobrevibacter sp. TaxID=253161 RepID=UPI0025E28096|nr:hypothetical protein [uncultured Methanobrevibacter sp.]
MIKSNDKPENAREPKSGKGECVMSFVAQTIAKRVTTCFGREHNLRRCSCRFWLGKWI